MSGLSSVPTVKASLLAALQARPGLDDVQVEYAPPMRAELQRECMYFDTTSLDEEDVVLGQRRRDETYTLRLVVLVALDGDDPQACEERMWVIVGEVEQLLRDDPTPDRAFYAEFRSAIVTPLAGDGQRATQADIDIRCRARKPL